MRTPRRCRRLEHRERRADGLGPLDGDQQGDPPAADYGVDVGGPLDDGHISPVEVCDLAGQRDDLQGAPQRRLPDELLLGEDGQDLEHHAARSQSGQPVVSERVGRAALAPVHAGQQQVVVRVGDGHRCLRRSGHPHTRPSAARSRGSAAAVQARGPTALTMTRQPPPGT